MDSIDLSSVSAINILGGYQKTFPTDFAVEVRLDNENGKVIGTGTLTADKSGGSAPGTAPIRTASAHCMVQPVADGAFHTLYFVFTPKTNNAEGTASIRNVQFR